MFKNILITGLLSFTLIGFINATPLEEAIAKGDVDEVRTLIQKEVTQVEDIPVLMTLKKIARKKILENKKNKKYDEILFILQNVHEGIARKQAESSKSLINLYNRDN